jgi:hypothetical protein
MQVCHQRSLKRRRNEEWEIVMLYVQLYIHPPPTEIMPDKNSAWDGTSLHVPPWTESTSEIAYEEAINELIVKT